MPEGVAVLVSGAFFGGLHSSSSVQMLYAIALGILLGWLYTKSENIIYPMLLHASFNLMNFVLVGDKINAFLETTVGMLCYYFAGVAALAGGIALIRKMEKPPLIPQDYNDGIVD
jgi:membrane protease YdiL (CAAX protease family)